MNEGISTMTTLPVYIYKRDFKAPLTKVWRAWTDPKQLAVWYGPGVETIIHAYDLKPGGSWLNEMKWGEKSDYSRMDFTEVVEEEKLVWNHASTNDAWTVQSNPMMPDWPKTLLTTVSFKAVDTGCRVQLEQVPVDASEVEIACFTQMMGNMDHGWGKGFDLLSEIISKASV
jgi:uncharacterized protein YndB with AHSA1/START domain